MKIVTFFILSIIAMPSFAQQKISLQEVNNHINDSIEVRSKVSEIYYLSNEKGSPTIINIGGKSPKQQLSIVLPADIRKSLHYNPHETKFMQGVVIVRGKVVLVKGKPQIVINDSKQLSFIIDEEVKEPPPIINK